MARAAYYTISGRCSMTDKSAVVLGAGGFIGSHLVRRLKSEGYWVRGVDLKYPEFSKSEADEMLIYDLRDPRNVEADAQAVETSCDTVNPESIIFVLRDAISSSLISTWSTSGIGSCHKNFSCGTSGPK